MTERLRPLLRVAVGPLALACVAAVALRSFGTLAQVVCGYTVFVLGVFAIAAWGRLHLYLVRRRLRGLRAQRRTRR